MNVKVFPNRLEGTVIAPPSKSYLQRAIILSAFSNEKTLIKADAENLSSDVISALEAVKSLGAKVDFGNIGIEILPIDRERLPESVKINAMESGATLRFFIPIVAFLGISAEFSGSGSLLNRPFDEYFDALKGVEFSANTLPFCMTGKCDGEVAVSTERSSQYLSGLLLASSICGGKIKPVGKTVSKPYVSLTLDLINRFNVNVTEKNGLYTVKKQPLVSPKVIDCEGDYSSCAFYNAVNRICGNVTVKGLTLNSKQGDKVSDELLERIFNGSVNVDITDTPDLLPILAVASCFTNNTVTFNGVARLKEKESDRPKNVCDLICKMKGRAVLNGDSLTVYGSGKLKGGCTLDFFGDHRITEACVLASTFAEEPTEIRGVESVKKSYPRFIKDVIGLGGRIDVIRL